jgi:hypothetical protein
MNINIYCMPKSQTNRLGYKSPLIKVPKLNFLGIFPL